MKALQTSFEVERFCDHRDPDRSETQCHSWWSDVTVGCITHGGVIQLRTLWTEEDGIRHSWSQMSDEEKQEAFTALDEENCRQLTELALQAVAEQ